MPYLRSPSQEIPLHTMISTEGESRLSPTKGHRISSDDRFRALSADQSTSTHTRRMGTPIQTKGRYVHFEHSERQISRALEDRDGPTVILLYGNTGTGKSTLARSFAQHYSESETAAFELVLYVHCGPTMNIDGLLFELMWRFDHTSLATYDDEMMDQVRSHLFNRKVLLVLENVGDGELLREMVDLCGTAVKCLVTSQDAHLCDNENYPSKFIAVPIQKMDRETAQRFLANHSGLSERMIPAHLKEVIENLVESSELDLMALTSIGSMVNKTCNNDLDEWLDVQETLTGALETIPLSVMNQQSYTKSFWATTRFAVESLSEDARKLLLLVYACEGPTVPEEILQVLYRSRKFTRASVRFSKVKSELESLHLVKVVELGCADFPVDVTGSTCIHEARRYLSMHTLHRLYIQTEMQNEVDGIFFQILNFRHVNVGNRSGKDLGEASAVPTRGEVVECADEEVLYLLCALYLSWPLLQNAIRNPKLLPSKLAHENSRCEFRHIVQPIVLSLGRSSCPKRAQRLIKEVFVALFHNSNGFLQAPDEERWLKLLEFPATSSAAWTVLKRMFAAKLYDLLPGPTEFTMHMETSLRLLEAMLVKLQLSGTCSWREDADNDRVRREQMEVIEVIACASDHSGFRETLLNADDNSLASALNYYDGIIRALIQIIKQEPSLKLKILCLRAFEKVVRYDSCGDHNQRRKIDSVAMYVLADMDLKHILRDALCDDGNPELQASALRCFRKLAELSHMLPRGSSATKKRKVTSDLQEGAGEYFDIQLLSEFVRLLTKDAHPRVKQGVLWAVLGHVQHVVKNQVTFVNIPNAMGALGQLIRSAKGSVLFWTLELLALLSELEDISLKMKITDTRGVVVGLLHIMDDDDSEFWDCHMYENMERAGEVLIRLGVKIATDMTLSSSEAYHARSKAHKYCGMVAQALRDDHRAEELRRTGQKLG